MDFGFAFRRYSLDFRHPVRTSQGAWPVREGVFVRVERPDGTLGFGEAAPVPAFGRETVDETEAGCRSLGDRLGEGALAGLPPNLRALRNALVCAMGGNSGPPSHRSLGMAALLPAGRDGARCRRAPQGRMPDFGYFKWKVGVEVRGRREVHP
jgi:O-succinylbenzoate synthase